jgi:ketosteroid isomerase-like protein
VDFEERKALVRKVTEHWNAAPAEVTRYSHPQGVVHSALTGETYEGHAGLERWMREIDEQFDRWELRADEFRDLEPDGLVVTGSISMRGRASGVELEQPVVWLYRIRDELIYEMTVYTDIEEGLAAAEEAARSR